MKKVKLPKWLYTILGVISRFFLLFLESTKVVTIMFAFIFLFFFGLIIAPIVWMIKWILNVWGKYYNWLFDWYVSNGL